MKKLNTNNAGRMPLWQADLDWMQQSYTETIAELFKVLGMDTPYFVVTGCQVTHADGISITGGLIWWNGELLPVRPFSSDTTPSPFLRLTRVSYNPEAGARNFIGPDMSPVAVADTWQDDYIQPELLTHYSPTDDGEGVYIRAGALTLREIMARRIAGGESGWQNTQSEISADDVQFKRIGRMVVLKGTVLVRDGSATPMVEGLPVPLTPTYLVYSELTHGVTVSVNAQGKLNCVSVIDLATYRVDGMMYMAAEPYNPPFPNNPFVVEP